MVGGPGEVGRLVIVDAVVAVAIGNDDIPTLIVHIFMEGLASLAPRPKSPWPTQATLAHDVIGEGGNLLVRDRDILAIVLRVPKQVLVSMKDGQVSRVESTGEGGGGEKTDVANVDSRGLV